MTSATGLIWGPDVLVPVPVKLAEDVWRYVEHRKAGRGQSVVGQGEGDSASAAVIVQGQGPWDEPMVRRLLEENILPGPLALLDKCAASPGEWISKTPAEQSAKVDPLTMRNQLGALSKAAKRAFGRKTWPMAWRKESSGQYVYKMDSAVAEWWKAARR